MGNARNLIIWIALFLLVIGLFNVFNSTDQSQTGVKISFSEFMKKVNNGTISRVVLDGEKVFIKAGDGANYQTVKPEEVDVTGVLLNANVEIVAAPQEKTAFMSTVSLMLPFLLLIGVDILHEPYARWWPWWRDGFWKIQGEIAKPERRPQNL